MHLTSYAQQFSNTVSKNLSLYAGLEIRKTNFRWSIAGNTKGEHPNIYSEIIFDPIRSSGYYAEASYKIHKHISITAHYNHLYTYKGNVTDFDYADDNRTNPTTELHLKSDKGKQSSVNGNVLYHILNRRNFTAASGIGYSYSNRQFYLLNDNDPTLQTTYSTIWKGPQISATRTWQSPWLIKLGVDAQLRLLKYTANGNWNLIEEFQHPISFTHAANGFGWNFSINTAYKLNRHIDFAIYWLNSNWKTNHGLDKLYLKTGAVPETRMNGAIEKSAAWRLCATYNF